MFKKKYKFFSIIISTVILITYLFKDIILISNNNLIEEEEYTVSHYIKFFKTIPYLADKISKQNEQLLTYKHLINYDINLFQLELNFKKSLDDIKINSFKRIDLSNDYTLYKYKIERGFYSGIYFPFPGSAYLGFHLDKFLILSSRGVLGYSEDINKINTDYKLKQIKNNINKFIGIKEFQKSKSLSVKDLLIKNEKIYISFTEEIEPDCWNTSVISGEINFKEIQFNKIFSPKTCVHSKKNPDKEFRGNQSGGRIVDYDKNHILLSIGEYRSRYLAQEKKSVNGKIIKINVNDYDYEIFSMGHRNPQGLYFDKKLNVIIETEHGPLGGDEINLIDIKAFEDGEIQNFGWPIVSAGEHYGGKNNSDNIEKYKKYPLYKSHKKYGFIKPLKSFVPSIGISELTKINKNRYVLSSLKDKSIYFFEINDKRELINLERVAVHERIRDLVYKNNKIYLFLEDTGSIGVIKIY